MLARRPAGVDVDLHQGFGGIDDQIAAGFELDERLVHARQLILDAEALEQGHLVGIGLNPPDVTRHQELHEGARGLVPLLTLDRYFVDVAVIDVADSALDAVAVAIDQSGQIGRESSREKYVSTL